MTTGGCCTIGNPFKYHLNSLWPSDVIWRQGSRSILAQVMACCLTAPSHYLNQCWLIICKVQWHSSEGNFAKDASGTNHWNKLKKITYIKFRSNLPGANESKSNLWSVMRPRLISELPSLFFTFYTRHGSTISITVLRNREYTVPQ